MTLVRMVTTTYHYLEDDDQLNELRQNVKDGVSGHSLRGQLMDKHQQEVARGAVRPQIDWHYNSTASESLVAAWDLYYTKIACSENNELAGGSTPIYRAAQALVKTLMLKVYGPGAQLALDLAIEAGELPSPEFVAREMEGEQLGDVELEIASVEELLTGDPWKQES